MKIIFMGTPDFAVPTLKKLISSKHEIIAVYTKPPKPSGRGYAESKSPIHLIAEENNIKVFTPSTLKTPETIEEFKNLKADTAVVAAYGLILPQAILEASKHGCINIHPSKLPRWRGAAPLQHTILAGDKETAICIMQMDTGMDTGDILAEKNLTLDDKITAKELHDKTSEIGADMVLEALDLLEKGQINRQKQNSDGVTHAHKITKEHEKINWNKTAFEINCQIRTLSPRPGAYFKFNEENIKIIQADYSMEKHDYEPGTVSDDKLTIACKTGFIYPKLLQREGKKMIYTDAFLRGFNIAKGAVLNTFG